MMVYARSTTLQVVEGMDMTELDALLSGFSNSFGMLLSHMAARNLLYHVASFGGRDIFEAHDHTPSLNATTIGRKREKMQSRTLESLLTELETPALTC